jgi:type IV pilus assembly protein PilQ
MRTRFPPALFFAILVSHGFSQPAPVAPTPADPAPAASAAPAPEAAIKDAAGPAATKSHDAHGQDTLSVDFPDEEIRNILRNVADLFELNVIIPEALQGRASIKLRDVSWRQIFQSVLDPIGYTYVEDGNIIKIVTKDSLNDEPVSTEVFVFNYARAGDVLPTITSLIDPAKGGKIVVDVRSNSLVITERPSRMNRVRAIIEQLDRATDQVMIESKFVEVTDADTKNLGVNWSSLSAYTINTQPTNLAVRGGNAIPRNGDGTLLTQVEETSTSFAAVFSASQFQTVLSALQSQTKTKVVSNPTIVTLNNSEATINVGEERPIPNYAYSEQTGTFQISGFTYKPIGVLLRVTPQVNSRGFIKLTISPEVSQSTSTVTFGGASATEIPVISTRKATTQVSLKNGYTMGLGGLLTQSLSKKDYRVPLLGSIPGLGRLFRSNSKEATTTNLIIFISARAVSSDGAPLEQTFDSAQIRQLEMRREELPGHRDGSDPFLKEPEPPAKAAGK